MKPVHSSLTPFFEEPGHFHAMTFLLELERLSYSSVRCAQVNASRLQSCPKDTVERTDRLDYRKYCGSTSSIDRKFPSTARRRNIPARAVLAAFSSSDGGGPWFRGGVEVHRWRPGYWRPRESQSRGSRCVNAAMPAARSAVLSARRAKRAEHSASSAANRLQPAAPGRAQPSAYLLQSSLESSARVLAVESNWLR